MFIIVKSFVWTLLYSIFFYLFYNQIFADYPSDIKTHVSIASNIDTISYPLWHLSIRAISDLFNVSLKTAAALFTPFVVLTIYIIITKLFNLSITNNIKELTDNNRRYLVMLSSLIILTASAIYFPFFNNYLYVGQSSCGVWHNVTLLMVKPFALLSFFITVQYIVNKNKKYLIPGIFITIASILAKPSYIIAFLPSLYIYSLYYIYKNSRGFLISLFDSESIKQIINNYLYIVVYLAALTLASVFILASQYASTFGEEAHDNTRIVFDYLGVWSLYTPSVLISLILTLAFPLLVLIFVNHKKSDMYILSIIMLIVSIAWYALFAESGPRYKAGNFGWSLDISYQIVFMWSMVEFFKGYRELPDWKKYILSILLSLHVVSGIFYLGRMLSGGPFS